MKLLKRGFTNSPKEKNIMPNITRTVLSNYAIGFDSLFQALENIKDQFSSNYPPHNITKIDENNFKLSLAVAGFTKEELSITLHPFSTNWGAHTLETSPPAENKAKSISFTNKSSSEIIVCVLPKYEMVCPQDFLEATVNSSLIGKFLSARTANISLPTIPVTPTIANFICKLYFLKDIRKI